ncbi:uncharacterized protein LOC132558915 [Ylistrum balloti]|uniref:uncharacterized protein LOC132558915 n=1 Tax=Ylistrum balloti TaxID=509963 RepID=UPI002905AD91|nr:uncharacterized protein LOC132558915 [Ylistrum balloti]
MVLHHLLPGMIYMFFLRGLLFMEVAGETTVFMGLEKSTAFEDKIMMLDISSSLTTLTQNECALTCVSLSLCLSFFYKRNSQLCQLHDLVFTDPSSSLVSVNTSYFYITHGNSVLQPIKSCGEPPAEPNVTWVTGTNAFGSTRQFTCTGTLLPTAYFIECMASGIWTQTSGYCRDVTLENCEDVQMCSSTNLDGTYLLYPPVLGGHGVNIYCHNMATVPQAYVTLFEENMSRNDYSKRTNSAPCQFIDRNGDASAIFDKILVNLADMSVVLDDFTFSTTCRETTRPIPRYGEALSCSFDNIKYPTSMSNCPAPGVFVINTNGTRLIVDPNLTWKTGGYAPRLEYIERSSDGYIIHAAFDGWCGSYKPSNTMYLHVDPYGEQRGTASTPICPDL